MQDTETTLVTLRERKTLGIRLAIEISAPAIRASAISSAVPVDTLKIDKAFITTVARGGSNSCSRDIVTLAELLKMGTVCGRRGRSGRTQREQPDHAGLRPCAGLHVRAAATLRQR